MPATDCYQYVRNYYHVPAYIGARIQWRDRAGVLVKRSAGHGWQYVDILFDGDACPCGPFPYG